jgi:hypothetical protein
LVIKREETDGMNNIDKINPPDAARRGLKFFLTHNS